MKKLFGCLVIAGLLGLACYGQAKPKPAVARTKANVTKTPSKTAAAKPPAPKPAAAKPVSPKVQVDDGIVTGQTYRNESLRLEITVPATWSIAGDDFEFEMAKKGFDLSLTAPESVGPQSRAQIEQALKRVRVLLTAYRAMPGSADNAILRVSVEDLSAVPQIKDAVDYFDAVRSQYASMTLPKGFTYSETQAEKLGMRQFAFLDSASDAGKKRLYATVRSGYAIIFSLTYKADDDLQTMRRILSEGDFALKRTK
jgi:hypothetical protein